MDEIPKEFIGTGVIDRPYTDYQDLVSKEDREKYFEGNSMYYNDPIRLATLRVLEKILEKLK